MKKLIMTLVILFSFIGCDWTIETIPRGGRIDDYDWELPQEIVDYMETLDKLNNDNIYFIGNTVVDSETFKIRKLAYFLYNYIEYTLDKEVWNYRNVWQLPETTWRLKTGDCEDLAILTMYVLYKFTGNKGRIARLSEGKNITHAILSFVYGDKELFIDSPSFYQNFSVLSQTYEIKEYISYEETIWICDIMEKEYELRL